MAFHINVTLLNYTVRVLQHLAFRIHKCNIIHCRDQIVEFHMLMCHCFT